MVSITVGSQRDDATDHAIEDFTSFIETDSRINKALNEEVSGAVNYKSHAVRADGVQNLGAFFKGRTMKLLSQKYGRSFITMADYEHRDNIVLR